jgi:hypothetical protein
MRTSPVATTPVRREEVLAVVSCRTFLKAQKDCDDIGETAAGTCTHSGTEPALALLQRKAAPASGLFRGRFT